MQVRIEEGVKQVGQAVTREGSKVSLTGLGILVPLAFRQQETLGPSRVLPLA